jgi:hypothetical protein
MSAAMLPAPRLYSWWLVVLLAAGLLLAGVLAGGVALLAGSWAPYPSARLVSRFNLEWRPNRVGVSTEYMTADPPKKVLDWYMSRQSYCIADGMHPGISCDWVEYNLGRVFLGRSTEIRAASYATTRILLIIEISYYP